MIGVGGGAYAGQSAFAVGMSKAFNDEHTIAKLSGTCDSRGRAGSSGGGRVPVLTILREWVRCEPVLDCWESSTKWLAVTSNVIVHLHASATKVPDAGSRSCINSR